MSRRSAGQEVTLITSEHLCGPGVFSTFLPQVHHAIHLPQGLLLAWQLAWQV
jgi:hypothetical protein